MKLALLCALGLLAANSLWADDLTQAVQQRLKDQGFYYGEVNGRGGDETSAAIRRYQIRRGLKVTGQLNDETLHALGVSSRGTGRLAPGYQEEEGPAVGQPTDPMIGNLPGNTTADRFRASGVPRTIIRCSHPRPLFPRSLLRCRGFLPVLSTKNLRIRFRRMCFTQCKGS